VSGSARVRLVILCEDTRHRCFLEALCEQWGIGDHQRRIHVAPKGTGDAKQWIRQQYAHVKDGKVRLVRSNNFQPKLGLLVMIDGDDKGCDARKRELDDALADAGLPRRSEHDRIGIFVPTWSIETWLLWFWGDGDIDESDSYKADGRAGGPQRAARFRAACNDRRNTEASAAFGWKFPRAGEADRLPSLADARRERGRLP
jgi:hypothetical protein